MKICTSQIAILLSIFFLVPFISVFSQGETCESAISVDFGITNCPGPIAGPSSSICYNDGSVASGAIWYKFESPNDWVLTINSGIDIDEVDTRLSVYVGDCNYLSCLTMDDDSGIGFTSELSFEASANIIYYFEWDNRWTTTEFDFEVSGVEIPTCTDDSDGDGIGDVCDIDIDGDLVPNEFDCEYLNGDIYQGATCNDGVVETIIDLINEDCICEGQLPDCIILGAYFLDPCDDGDPMTLNDFVQYNCVCAGYPIQSNFSCADAIPVGEGVFTDFGLFNGGGASNICFASELNPAENASWYLYTASASGSVYITSQIDPTLPDTRLSIYGDDCLALDCLTNDDDSGSGFSSFVAFDVVSGESYFIEWDDRWYEEDQFSFVITFDYLMSCPNLGYVGFPCDDGNGLSIQDQILPDCTCQGLLADGDIDMDGILDLVDNCPFSANSDQGDIDGDGIGDVCDNERDGDGYINDSDNCPDTPNPEQTDLDQDGIGDACDDDIDGDGAINESDCDPENGLIYTGASCDDGDPVTSGDAIQEDCSCEGVVGIDDLEQDILELKIYPNPANETLFLSFNRVQPFDLFYEIYDVSGRLILHDNVSQINGDTDLPINIKKLNQGLYIINLIVEEKQLSKRFVKSE